MADLPHGTVTFLFTDIEGSTRLWEQHPRVMQAAVARHDMLLRQVIEAHEGYVFKTVGDAFCATFRTAPQALDAALAGQQALKEADWESLGIAPLKVRMALHTGVAEVRDNDYFGLPLNRVARLLSTGYGGQILLSLATQQLVRDYLPEGVSLKDLGEGGLKDLARAEHVYQVVAPNLPLDFPPLKSLDAQYIEPGEDGVVRTAQNPYKGLRAFQESDAADFFGREDLTGRLLGRMAEEGPLCSFLAVVGPSGSGKSSVVRAGLVPALRQGRLAGSERWLVVEMLPGAHPLEELEALLLSIAVNPPESLVNQLREDERGLLRAIKRVLPRDESIGLVLVIDQFEEVFTLVEEEPARVHFLESLHAAVTDLRSRLRVVITLRADFFDRPLLYPDPGELMRQRTAVVLPLSAEELERAIVEPARRAGVSLEPELLATIIKDVGEQLGALPLLQYALTELFERRTGRVMTLAAYHESGGVVGALARRADEIYEELTDEEREAARQLFLRMVTLGEGVEDTRRRVRRSELQSLLASVDTGAQDRVIATFGKYRLLTFDMDPVTKGPTVEVAHEALIRTWGKLQEWLEASRDDLRVQRQLLTASTEWAASGKDRSFLATGARLGQFAGLTEGSGRAGGVSLTAEEREYLNASIEESERQEKLERERQAKELDLQKRAAGRLRALVAGLAVFLVIAAGLTAWALSQSQQAQISANEANAQREQAQRSEATVQANFTRSQAQLLAAASDSLVKSGSDPEIAALLSLRSLRTLYTPEGDAALGIAGTLRFPRLQLPATGGEGAVWAVAFSPDGKYLLTGSEDYTVMLWDASTGKKLRDFGEHADQVQSVAFSPDGKWALSGSADKTMALWDVETGRRLRQFLGHTDRVFDVAYSTDGKLVLSGSRDGTARLWDPQTGQEIRQFVGEDRIHGVAFSPDGKRILTGGRDTIARIWDAQTGQLLRTLLGHTDYIFGVAFSPDGKQVLTSAADRTARLWDAETGQALLTLTGHASDVLTVAFSPDGTRALTGGFDNTVRLWDLAIGQELSRLVSNDASDATAFSSDGQYIVGGSGDGIARVWTTENETIAPQVVHPLDVEDANFSPDGNWIVSSSSDGTARLWDARTGEVLREFQGHTDRVTGIVFSPDGKLVATSSTDRTARLWDAQSGQELRSFTDAGGIHGVAFSPDGKWLLTGADTVTDTNDVVLFDIQTGSEIRRFIGHENQVWRVAFSPDGKTIATAGLDETVRLWEAETGKQLRVLEGTAGLASAAFSADGKMVVSSSEDGAVVQLWDVQTGQEVRRLTNQSNQMWDAVFSADGKLVLSTGTDNTARLWDAQTGQEVRRFAGHTALLNTVAFSPDGKHILTGSVDHTARLWPIDYHEEVSFLCGRLSRDFTDQERTQFGIEDKEPTCPKP